MITDLKTTKELAIHGETADLNLGISASAVRAADAIVANDAFDRFVAEISGRAPEKKTITRQPLVPWTDDEKATVRPCKSKEEAWRAFHAAFPDSQRLKKSVTRWWMEYRDKPAVEPAGGLPAADPAPDNDPCNECREHEEDFSKCDKCAPPVKKPSAQQILKKIAKKPAAPQGKGNQNRAIHGDWSDTEKAAIAGCKDRDAAIKSYREKCPEGKRNDNAIGMKWYSLARDAKKKAKEERKARKNVVPVQETAENIEQAAPPVPPSDVVKPSAQAIPSSNDVKEPGDLTKGDRVQYVGSPKSFSGIGEVIQARPGHLEVVVDIGNGRMTVNRSNLAKVPA